MKPNKPEDIWKFVKKGNADECWPWIGAKFCNGYGRFFISQTSRNAHRFLFEFIHGPMKKGFLTMHKCNNRICCNPEHLYAGTNSENQRHASYSGAFKLGKTGIIGIGFDELRSYWTAQGWKDSKRINLYTGPSLAKAKSARKKWESVNRVSFGMEK